MLEIHFAILLMLGLVLALILVLFVLFLAYWNGNGKPQSDKSDKE